jgi:hypothetical protein
MLTKLVIRNFKRFEEVEIPLANPVVFVGPNNSGKTTALQALTLWNLGLSRWSEKRTSGAPEKRPGVAINRRDLYAVPVPDARQLWRGLHVRDVHKINGKQETKNLRIDINVCGNTNNKAWECGLEFDYSNEESFFCRPLRAESGSEAGRMSIPDEALDVQIAFLPPMSGLTPSETRLPPGAINVRLGEGRTAEVLRNLCYALSGAESGEAESEAWEKLVADIRELFGVTLETPIFVTQRGEIEMSYVDENNIRLDLSCSGRGLQQTVLLLAYLSLHPGAVLLLDEPDAHLEILRQREIYIKLREAAHNSGSQVIIASHSEEVLNQAARLDEDSIVAFLGKPHRIPGNNTNAVKSALNTVRYDQYYQAEQLGWVLYLEDYTDLSILRAFAEKLSHPVKEYLRSAFLCPIGNQINEGRRHFFTLIEAKRNLVGFLLVDSDATDPKEHRDLVEMRWERREIENYICQPETLEAFAVALGAESAGGPLLEQETADRACEAMKSAVRDRVTPAALRDKNDPWWRTVKASDEFLNLVFPDFFGRMGWYMDCKKADYHRLVKYIPDELVSKEVVGVLDKILEVAVRAQPAKD